MNRCYISLGSNQKHPERQIRQAIKALNALPKSYVTTSSSLYWNKAWGLCSQQNFCNAVLELQTTLTPSLLLQFCQKIEQKQGRVRKKHWGPRTLDVDIILYGARSIKTKKLTVPHPYYAVRDFVLIPLREISTPA